MGLAKSGPKPYLWTHDRRFPHIRRLYRPSHLSRRGCGRPAPDGGGVVRAGFPELFERHGRGFRFGRRRGGAGTPGAYARRAAPAYHRGCYAVRNDFLVYNARVLVAWYDGSPGGTRYTVRRALGRGLEVVNLCPAAPVPPAPEPTLFG